MKKLTDLTSLDQFKEISSGYYIAITDIKDSTKAISQGRYKQVNMVSASCIIAVFNNTRSKDIPYVFGGDGANGGYTLASIGFKDRFKSLNRI